MKKSEVVVIIAGMVLAGVLAYSPHPDYVMGLVLLAFIWLGSR